MPANEVSVVNEMAPTADVLAGEIVENLVAPEQFTSIGEELAQ